MIPAMVCRLCGEPAAAVITGGCVVYPEDRQQILCAQHWINGGWDDDAEVQWVDPWLVKMGYA